MTASTDAQRAALADEQRAWVAALLAPDAATLPWRDWRGGRRTAPEAGAVYVNNLRANAIHALEASYPLTLAALGGAAFRALVVAGLPAAAPTTGDLGVWGGWLADALGQDAARADLAWLARLEWSLDQAGRVALSAPWARAAATEALASDGWPHLRVRLRGPWRLWRCGPARLHLVAGSRHLVGPARDGLAADWLLQVGRSLFVVDEGDRQWLIALDEGASLEAATDRVLRDRPDWSPIPLLGMALAHEIFQPPGCHAWTGRPVEAS